MSEDGARLGSPRISACRPSGPARSGPDRDELDGPVQEQDTGLGVASGVDVRPEVLGVVLREQGPDEGSRARESRPLAVLSYAERGFSFGEEPAQAGVVDFADECLHQVVIARPGAASKRIRRGPRPGCQRLESRWKIRYNGAF